MPQFYAILGPARGQTIAAAGVIPTPLVGGLQVDARHRARRTLQLSSERLTNPEARNRAPLTFLRSGADKGSQPALVCPPYARRLSTFPPTQAPASMTEPWDPSRKSLGDVGRRRREQEGGIGSCSMSEGAIRREPPSRRGGDGERRRASGRDSTGAVQICEMEVHLTNTRHFFNENLHQ
jgi:hypothetical protein